MSARHSRDIDHGWAWIVAIAAYLIMLINCITLYMAGVLYIALLERYNEGKAKTSLVGAISSGLLCFLSPVSGVVINMFSCRVTMVSGCVLTVVGFVSSAFVNSLDATIVTTGLLVGCGYALTVAGNIVNIGYYFQKRRNLMVSLTFVFVGIGMFFSVPLGLLIIDLYGLSSSFLILAALYSQICVLSVLCKPSSVERKLNRDRAKGIDKSKYSKKKSTSYFNVSLICNKAFLSFLMSTSTWNFALTAAAMHLPNYLKVNGLSSSEIGWLLTSLSIANTTGRLCGAAISSRETIDALVIHIVTVGLAGVATVLFPFYSGSELGKYSFSIMFGLLCGIPNAFMTPLSIKFVGVAMLPEANGLSYFFCGIGVTAGPIITGSVFGLTGSYRYSFFLAGSVLLVGSLLAVIAFVFLRLGKDSTEAGDIGMETAQEKMLSTGDIVIIERQSVLGSFDSFISRKL